MFRVLPALLLVPALALAAPVPKEVKKERPTLDGTWELSSSESGGQKVAEKGQTWQIDGEALVIRYGKAVASNVRYTLVAPKDGGADAVDFVSRSDRGAVAGQPKGEIVFTQKGVYAVDGDTLTLCLNLRGEDRPAECKPGKGLVVYTFKRVKAEKK